MRPIRIATRASKLAMTQSGHVRDMIKKICPDADISFVQVSTQGDRDKSDFLYKTDSIGFFTSETLLLGIGLRYEYNFWEHQYSYNGTQSPPTIEKNHILFINPFATKYISLSDNFHFATTLSLLAGKGKKDASEVSEWQTIFNEGSSKSQGIHMYTGEVHA